MITTTKRGEKYVWLIERQDSLGEFQPMAGECYLDYDTAKNKCDRLLMKADQTRKARLRVIAYVRHINRS